MFTIFCFQCPVCCDLPFQDFAVREANRHAESYGHNVAVYRSETLDREGKRECVTVALGWKQKAA